MPRKVFNKLLLLRSRELLKVHDPLPMATGQEVDRSLVHNEDLPSDD